MTQSLMKASITFKLKAACVFTEGRIIVPS